MATIQQKYRLGFRDAKGWIGFTSFFVSGVVGINTADDYNEAAGTLLAAIEGLTNAALQSVGTGPVGFGPITLTYGTNAEYPAAWMKAVMQFSNGNGEITRFKIPAPKIAIMDTDGVTVLNDGTSAPVVAYVNAMKNAASSGTFISNADGVPYAHFEGGLVRLGKQPRRFNERIKSSHLVAGEGE